MTNLGYLDENRKSSDKPLKFDSTQFNASDDVGRSYAGLESREAIKRFFHSTSMSALDGVVGELEESFSERLNRDAIQPGNIPPKTFKDGIVFFEKPKKNTKEFKVNFV